MKKLLSGCGVKMFGMIGVALGLMVLAAQVMPRGRLFENLFLLVDKERHSLFIERETALQAARIANAKSTLLLGSVAGWAGFFIVVAMSTMAVLWLYKQTRQTHAVNGLYPLIELPGGALYDANRAVGEHPMITALALEVQKQAALKADKISVTIKNDGAVLEALAPAAATLPDMLPVSQVGQAYSLDALTIGQASDGMVSESLHNLMHVLAVGSSGWGKSSLLRYLLFQLAQCRESFDALAIDINGSEFNLIQGWNRLLYPVARNTGEAIALLGAFSEETKRRKELYEQVPMAYDLPSYNKLSDAQLKPQVLLVDEGTNLLNQAGIGEPLRDAAQTSRQYGQYLVVTGQSAKASVLNSQTRDNFTSRLCFHTSKPSYRVVLDESVEQLNVKGRAYCQLPGRELTTVQIPMVTKAQLLNVLTTGAPARQMPTVEPVDIAQDETVQQVIDLHLNGASDTKIAREVFGHGNGRYIIKVQDILKEYSL